MMLQAARSNMMNASALLLRLRETDPPLSCAEINSLAAHTETLLSIARSALVSAQELTDTSLTTSVIGVDACLSTTIHTLLAQTKFAIEEFSRK